MSHRVNEIKADLLSVLGLNPFPGHDSSPRAQMFSSHLTQSLVIKGSTERRLQTGVERELAKYTFSVKMPANGRIVRVIEKYPRDMSADSIAFNPETLVVYEDIDTTEIGSFTIPGYASYHQHFGFAYQFNTETMRLLVPGTVIDKGTIFADSPSVTKNGGYKYGVELNMALFTSHPVAEDGIMISRDVLDKLKFKVFETRSVQFGNHAFPINLYRNTSQYNQFADIGDHIRENGLLMMLRDYSKTLAPIGMSIHDVMEPDYAFDKAVYSRAGVGTVIDIKIYHNDDITSTTPIGMEQMLAKYVHHTNRYYRDIVNLNKELSINRYKKHGKGARVLYKPELHRLMVEALATLDDSSDPTSQFRGDAGRRMKASQKLNYLYKKTPIDDYRVDITVMYEITPDIGFKLTCCHGGKGVITKIEEPHNMPVDADGNRADIVMDSGSVVSRMNIGRLYEQYIGGACVSVQKKLKEMLGFDRNASINESLVTDVLSTNGVLFNQVKDYLFGFYQICSPKQYEYCIKGSVEEQLVHLTSCISDKVYLYMPTDNAPETSDIIRQLEQHYPQCYGPVEYGIGNTKIITDEPIRVAPLYMLMLEKIGDEWSSVSSAKLHHFGILASRTKSDKTTKPYRHTPVRTIGETEGRIYVSYCGREAAAEMMDRSNSPVTHRHIVENILKADKPTDIQHVIDRDKVPLGNCKSLQLIKHILLCSGTKMAYKSRHGTTK